MDHLEDEVGRFESSVYYDGHRFQDLFQPAKATPAYFHSFPQRAGLILENGRYKLEGGPITKRAHILQTWLFFGLIFTVVRKNGQSLLTYNTLLKDRGKDRITTENLNAALQEWADWEVLEASKNKKRVRIRMIRLGLVLKKARTIIRNYCSYENVSDEGVIESAWTREEKYTHIESSDSYLSGEAALSLMVIGETLATVKSNIMKKLNHESKPVKDRIRHVSGWHLDQDTGWGQPKCLIEQMRKDGWCPRTVFLLRRQFGAHATLMLNAYNAHKRSIHWKDNKHKERECDHEECKVKSERLDADGPREYATAHHDSSCQDPDTAPCELLGPDPGHLGDIFDQNDDDVFPLLQFVMDEEEVIGLKVEPYGRRTEYATISHVWSDGYGNEVSNRLWRCQLRFIRDLLVKVFPERENIRFWMDTLVIPVGTSDQTKQRKKKAIKQIHTVFKNAECCIVLDKSLVNMDKTTDNEPCQAAMKILASNWMRRLWTLQEAFLSQNIKVAFKASGSKGPLHDVRILLKDIQEDASDVKSILPNLIQQEVTQNIMWPGGSWNGDNISTVAFDNRQGKLVQIANSWHAARWRTTSNQAHETLALATLLGLQNTTHSSDEITMAGVRSWREGQSASETELDDLMAKFWESVDGAFRGAIPPGIIFLPGEKVDISGFRWAPRTFMTPIGTECPNPLSLLKQETVLCKKGLRVRCPGFFLHTDDSHEVRRKIVQTNGEFCFPIDNTFVEWYQVEPAADVGGNTFAIGVIERKTDLAIILSRPSPRGFPAEIGLLVEVYDIDCPVEETNSPVEEVHYAQVLFRVRVSRIECGKKTDRQQKDDDIFGEVASPDTRWCVDGYGPEKLPKNPNNATPSGSSGISRSPSGPISFLRSPSNWWKRTPQSG